MGNPSQCLYFILFHSPAHVFLYSIPANLSIIDEKTLEGYF